MAGSKTKSKKDDSDLTQDDEALGSLPVGHPRAGYVEPDLSFHDGTGQLPDIEKEWHQRRNERREEDVENVRDNEEKVALEEQEETQKRLERAQKEQEKLGQESESSSRSKSGSESGPTLKTT